MAMTNSKTGGLPWLAMLLAVLGALSLSACVTYAPPRPFTTEAETLAAKGEPTRRWQDDDGTHTLEYATQPNGRSCLMVQVDQAASCCGSGMRSQRKTWHGCSAA